MFYSSVSGLQPFAGQRCCLTASMCFSLVVLRLGVKKFYGGGNAQQTEDNLIAKLLKEEHCTDANDKIFSKFCIGK